MAGNNGQGMNWIKGRKRLAIYIADGFACFYCRRDLKEAKPGEITLDHLIPRSKGGDNAAGNLITACRRCNSSRADLWLAEWFRVRYRDQHGRWPKAATADNMAQTVFMYAARRVLNYELADQLIAARADAGAESVEDVQGE